jgi:hypothetical protein
MKKFFLILMIIVLSGCNNTPYIEEHPAYVLFKTPTFKYADMGFVYKNKDEIKLQIYSNAQSIMSLTVSKNSVCMSTLECMSSQSFNTNILNKYYPVTILYNILRGKEILAGKNLIKTNQGFIQQIKTIHYDIVYKVAKNSISFIDRVNNIKIKIVLYN